MDIRIGQKMPGGKLTVLAFNGNDKWKHTLLLVRCDCGIEKTVTVGHFKVLKSCGCYKNSIAHCNLPTNVTHGQSFRNNKTPEYCAYTGAKRRCTNPNAHYWKDYGGRGIKFLFESFEEFFAEIGPRPSSKYSLDRVDNDGNYEAGNIRWATAKQQTANRRCMKQNIVWFTLLLQRLKTTQELSRLC